MRYELPQPDDVSPWSMSRIRASCEQDIHAWQDLSGRSADDRRSSCPSLAAADDGDDVETVVASLPVMWPVVAAAVVDTGAYEAVEPLRRPYDRRRSRPTVCV